MARIHPTYSLALLFTLLTSQMFSAEAREIKSPNRAGIKHIKYPSLIRTRKLGTVNTHSGHSESSTMKIAPQKTNTNFPETMTYDSNVPSMEPCGFPKSSHIGDSLHVKEVESDGHGDCRNLKTRDDYRPAAPENSNIRAPGHFSLPVADKISPNQRTPKIWKTLASSSDDYRHTTPGRSPGAGHPEPEEGGKKPSLRAVEEKKYFLSKSSTPSSVLGASAIASENDFRPTAPGLSPGAGHSDINENDRKESGHCPNDKCTEDFRPTAPGESPGAGHSFVKNDDSNRTEQAKQLGFAHTNAGQTDDYRPTAPGHSPGAGHPVLKETRKPNS